MSRNETRRRISVTYSLKLILILLSWAHYTLCDIKRVLLASYCVYENEDKRVTMWSDEKTQSVAYRKKDVKILSNDRGNNGSSREERREDDKFSKTILLEQESGLSLHPDVLSLCLCSSCSNEMADDKKKKTLGFFRNFGRIAWAIRNCLVKGNNNRIWGERSARRHRAPRR